jgi:sterol desaturase/sphingolipid hydroxylase (fatty acid hydroxylase superfamily)
MRSICVIMKSVLLTALVLIVLCALLEAVVLHVKRRNYDWRSCSVSMVNMVARTVVTIVVPLSLITPFAQWAWQHRITTMPLDAVWAFVLLFVGQEFCYYWFHRASHRVRWFWGNHAVHHSPNDLTLAAALRLGVFGRFIGTGLFFCAADLVGFPARGGVCHAVFEPALPVLDSCAVVPQTGLA